MRKKIKKLQKTFIKNNLSEKKKLITKVIANLKDNIN